MFRPIMNRLALAAVMATGVLSVTANQSEAGWHWWRCGWHRYYSPCYTTVYRPVVCSPVVYRTSCYSPVRRYSRACYWRSCYRPCTYTYYSPCYSCSYCYDPCCGGVVYDQGGYQSAAPAEGPTSAEPEPGPDVAAPAEEEPTTLPSLPEPPATDAPAPVPAETDAAAPAPAPAEAGATAPAPAPQPAGADAAAPAPAPEPAEADATEPPPVPGAEAMNPQTGSVTLAINVPADATVYVNGRLTRTPGTLRRYVSRGLVPGYEYTYKIRAVVNRNGNEASDEHVVHVRAGESKQLAFNFDRTRSQQIAARVPTTLTVRVPEGAEVKLEGRDTQATGLVRRFVTNELAKGERWEGYNVVVRLDRDGRVDTHRKTINLIGGQSHELSFDFGPARLALR